MRKLRMNVRLWRIQSNNEHILKVGKINYRYNYNSRKGQGHNTEGQGNEYLKLKDILTFKNGIKFNHSNQQAKTLRVKVILAICF